MLIGTPHTESQMQLFWSLVLLFLFLLPVFCHSVMLNHCLVAHAGPLKYWGIRLQELHWNEYNNENQKAAQTHCSGKEAANKCSEWILGRRTRGASCGQAGTGLSQGPVTGTLRRSVLMSVTLYTSRCLFEKTDQWYEEQHYRYICVCIYIL